jgi:hypothetical protein
MTYAVLLVLSTVVWLSVVLTAITLDPDPELNRHDHAYKGTYYIESPWSEVTPLSKRENPEDGKHKTEVFKSKPTWR